MAQAPQVPRVGGYRRLGRQPKQILRAYRLRLDPPLVGRDGRIDEDGGLREVRGKFRADRRARRTAQRGASA